ncbi:hypothetical protein SDC9_89047 [bioreactor metagenome]|uniref:Uncharacterized protein n=1 Tax=bioreactor metagenome TaxID=1076179 RepID=A0A644ZNG2_9ZZZZ
MIVSVVQFDDVPGVVGVVVDADTLDAGFVHQQAQRVGKAHADALFADERSARAVRRTVLISFDVSIGDIVNDVRIDGILLFIIRRVRLHNRSKNLIRFIQQFIVCREIRRQLVLRGNDLGAEERCGVQRGERLQQGDALLIEEIYADTPDALQFGNWGIILNAIVAAHIEALHVRKRVYKLNIADFVVGKPELGEFCQTAERRQIGNLVKIQIQFCEILQSRKRTDVRHEVMDQVERFQPGKSAQRRERLDTVAAKRERFQVFQASQRTDIR